MVLILLASVGASVTEAAQYSVEAVKAAYLFRFAQFVEWPEVPADTPFVFAVNGAEDVAVHLERLVNGMTVNGRHATVRRVTRAQELEGAQVLFVGADAFNRTRALRSGAIKRPILVVTDDENGLDGGGVINFIEINRNLRFEISLNAADRSGLKINSALLSVAARVERRPQGAINCLDGYPRLQRSAGCRIRMASVDVGRGER
ncbi:MAG TPA: YfiR family protein [Steroidobacteraceae bacterium]|nr:YfiR family protein [Steroidobacteraceae bacterium]